MKSSAKKALAAVLSIALLLVIIIFLNSGRDSERNVVPQDPPDESNPVPSAELVTGRKPEKQPDIFGVVEDENGNLIEGALVKALEAASSVYGFEALAKSTPDGKYSIFGLNLGKAYELTASARGFQSSSEEVNPGEQPTELDFVLAKIEPGFEPAAEPAPDELETILSNARAAIEKIRSGRFVYEYSTIMPNRMTEREYNGIIESHAEALRRGGATEARIQEAINERIPEWQERLHAQGNSQIDYEGEHIFEGDNRYSSVLRMKEEEPHILYSGYIHDGKIVTTTSQPGSNPPDAYISNGTNSPNFGLTNLHSPLESLKRAIQFLQNRDSWNAAALIKSDPDGEAVYDLSGATRDYWSSMQILPQRDHLIKSYALTYRHSKDGRILSYDDIKQDANTGIYYPAKITETVERDGRIKFKFVYDILEVEFNRDYDDDIFKPVFEEGTRIIDHRFEPYRIFTYSHPDFADEYLAQLDEEAKQLEDH